MTQKDLLSSFLETAINHYSREAIIGALDFIANLSAEEIKEWSLGMEPEQVARVYRVWKAAQFEGIKLP